MRKELLTSRDDIFVVHDFLSPADCEEFISRSEAAGFSDAPINQLGGPVIRKDIRNNERVIVDDRLLAHRLWQQSSGFVPAVLGQWRACGLNERFRFYRYHPGQLFDWHFDGAYERSPLERSALTFMIYLNEGFEGGDTEINLRSAGGITDEDPLLRIQPRRGMLLVFNHRLLHQGAVVSHGVKYVLRSDVMYRWASDGSGD